MADALISALVDHAVSRTLQKIEDEVKLVGNAKGELQKLKQSLTLIQALLQDAGTKQFESTGVKQWLSDLERVSYDMDDLLGEWNAAILVSEIEREGKKKVGSLFQSFCFCFKQSVREVISLREFAKKIKELNEELDVTKRLGNELGIVSRVVESSDQHRATGSSVPKPRITTSFVDETEIQGRVEEKALLVSRLLCESSDADSKGKCIDVVPVVGMGGLGKTTLAQMAYNDDRVKAHFDKRIWVSVSDPFDLLNIAKCLIEGLGGKSSEYGSLETMMKFISTSIEGKRFLLVLDDVWSEDREKWDQLHQPLQNGSWGSRILVTTRNTGVANMMGVVSSQKIVSLHPLTEEQCWSIIKQLALVEENNDEFFLFEAIGRKIACKCNGLPLPAKILGGLMCKKSKKQWKDILDSQLWKSKFEKIFAPLLLSYYDLSHVEKCCFLYCSVIPKDQDINMEKLVEMWSSQGYFDESSEGLVCFQSLAMRSFFQDFRETDGGDQFCKMHDIVHDFAQYLTRDKSVLIEEGVSKEEIESLDDKARYLTINSLTSSPTAKLVEVNRKCKFRSLTVVQSEPTENQSELDFLNLTCFRRLRTLNLEKYNYLGKTLLHEFPKMVHLRFLDLSTMYSLKVLPESLCDLCNLQTLRLDNCWFLKRLPTRFGKLVNLRHLHVSNCRRLEGFPIGFENLTRLQTLDAVVVAEDKDAYFDISDLKKLGGLRFQGTLSLTRCSNFTSAGEAEKLSIATMEDIIQLNLNFFPSSSDEHNREAAILEALKPHPNLQSLEIRFYHGIIISPTWLLSLTNLKNLSITMCSNCEILPPLGRLPSLQFLFINHMPRLKKVGHEFLGIDNLRDIGGEITTPFVSFPRLKELHFRFMSKWREWEGISEAASSSFLSVMPCLTSLTFDLNCWSVEALPDFLLMTPLQSLSICDCEALEKWCREGEGKQWLERSNITDIRFSN